MDFQRHQITHDSNGNRSVVSAAHLLPLDYGGGTIQDIVSTNTAVFIQWCKVFVHHVQHLTSNGRNILLLYDSLRAHLSFRCFTSMNGGGVKVYPIPTLTSGSTQPLDAAAFGPSEKSSFAL